MRFLKKILVAVVPTVSSVGAYFLIFFGEKPSLKSLFSSKAKAGRVLLNTSKGNHDAVWTAMADEIKKDVEHNKYPDFPEKANLTSNKLKEYCNSLSESDDADNYEKYEKLCSRNNWKTELGNFVSGNGWQERKEKFSQQDGLKPDIKGNKDIEEWCDKKGEEPWALKGTDNDFNDISNWCTVDGLSRIDISK